jgi:polyhydroxyalkanoate synthesis regulator phasin
MAIEEIEEQLPIFTEETEAELSDKMKKLLLEVIDKGRINLEHGTGILSEVIARKQTINFQCRKCIVDCNGCNSVCGGCNSAVGCACKRQQ